MGQSYEFADEYNNSIAGSNFFSPDLIGVGAAQVRRVAGSGRQNWALFSAFSRVNYQLKKRYMAGVTYRIDGSSRFNCLDRFLGTPSVSAGWRLSEEQFIKENYKWIDDLKLRGSIGWSSKDGNLGYYGAQAVYTLSTVNYGGNNYLMVSQPGNENLSWERTITYDIGLDAAFLDNRIGIMLDYYYRKTTDMLFPSDLPAYTGYIKQNQNIADMSNQGIELQLRTTNIQSKNFMWMSILNVSSNTNKILRLNFEWNQLDQANSSFKYYAVGYPMAQWYLHEWAGVDPDSGNPLWRLADGTITDAPPAANYDMSQANKKVSGTALPTFYGGLTNQLFYKNFDMNFMFSFSYGGRMINSTKATLMTYSTEDAYNLSKDILKFWQIPGQLTDVPKLKNKSILNNYDYTAAITTTRYLEDNSFIRLKNLSIGYNLPKSILDKTKIFSQFKIFAAATNLFTITPYSGLDPEVSAFGSSTVASGYDYMTMPQTRSLQLGIRVEM